MIQLPSRELERMNVHARAAYPRECCGALLGHAGWAGAAADDGLLTAGSRDSTAIWPEPHKIIRADALHNDAPGEHERRYVIASETLRRVETAATRDGLDVVGFYHSHPDYPAEPSAFDIEHAWPWYAYVIVPVHDATPGRARAWRLTDDRAMFREEQLVVLEEVE